MAVFTVGQFFICFGNRRAVYAADEIFIDAFVAGCTCGREVFVVDG